MELLKINNLSKFYGRKKALNSVSLVSSWILKTKLNLS